MLSSMIPYGTTWPQGVNFLIMGVSHLRFSLKKIQSLQVLTAVAQEVNFVITGDTLDITSKT